LVCSFFNYENALSKKQNKKREARVRETNLSSKNGGLTDGLVNLPRKIKVLINKDAQPWTLKEWTTPDFRNTLSTTNL